MLLLLSLPPHKPQAQPLAANPHNLKIVLLGALPPRLSKYFKRRPKDRLNTRIALARTDHSEIPKRRTSLNCNSITQQERLSQTRKISLHPHPQPHPDSHNRSAATENPNRKQTFTSTNLGYITSPKHVSLTLSARFYFVFAISFEI